MITHIPIELRTDGSLILSSATTGDPGGEPVVLLHGFTDSWTSMRPLMEALPRNLRVVAISLRGHGDSTKPEALRYDMRSMAADVVAVLDRLGIGAATIVGHCMGGLVAQCVVAMVPERIRRLVLIGSVRSFKGHPDLLAMWQETVSTLQDPVDPGFVLDFQTSTLARPVAAAFMAGVVDDSLKVPARVWRSILDVLLTTDPVAGTIRVPTCLIWGEKDALCRDADRRLLMEATRDARVIQLADAGHSPHWEDPYTVARHIATFIADTRSSSHPTDQSHSNHQLGR